MRGFSGGVRGGSLPQSGGICQEGQTPVFARSGFYLVRLSD